jgi:hypothetical protein
MTSPIDAAQAANYRTDDGMVMFAAPHDPWAVGLAVEFEDGRASISSLRVDVRDPRAAVTAARLAALPLAHLLHVAAVARTPGVYPNEAYYRMLARPKPAGRRRWDEGHWGRVLAIHQWGREVEWPGGPRQAVANLYGVSLDPTVNRWLSHARRRAADSK